MEKMERFETERVILRRYTLDDLDAIVRITRHPDVWKFDPGYLRSRAETRTWLVFRMFEISRHGIGRMAVTHKADNTLIGHVGLQLCLYAHPQGTLPSVELFYGLDRAYWGQGYITEACQVLIAFAFENLKLPRIISAADADNAPSRNVQVRLGMHVVADPLDAASTYASLDNPAIPSQGGV